MKLFTTALIVVLTFCTVYCWFQEEEYENDEEEEIDPSWIYCYSIKDGHEALNNTFREERINGTYGVEIKKCKFCEYKMMFWAEGSQNNPYKGIYVNALWEYFICHREGEIEREHECKAQLFYDHLNGPFNIVRDRIVCDTDLCNKPCYQDPRLPTLPSTTTVAPTTRKRRRRKKKSNGFSLYSFGVLILLRYITAFMVLFK